MNYNSLIKIFILTKKILNIENLCDTKICVLSEGLTNKVIKLSYNTETYIIKIFNKIHDSNIRLNELFISKKCDFIPNIIYQNSDFRIEKFINSIKYNDCEKLVFFNFHYKNLMTILKLFHSQKTFYNDIVLYKFYNQWKDSHEIKKLCLNIPHTFNKITKFINDSHQIVYCHNDVILNNILVSKNMMYLIDLEYSGNNYLLYEFANMFNEILIDYDNYSYRKSGIEWLKEIILIDYFGDNIDIKQILIDITKFQKISNFLWTLWSFKQLDYINDNDFDYARYGHLRLEMFNN